MQIVGVAFYLIRKLPVLIFLILASVFLFYSTSESNTVTLIISSFTAHSIHASVVLYAAQRPSPFTFRMKLKRTVSFPRCASGGVSACPRLFHRLLVSAKGLFLTDAWHRKSLCSQPNACLKGRIWSPLFHLALLKGGKKKGTYPSF